MEKFKLANGWTKESVIAQIKKYNNGQVCMDKHTTCLYQHPENNNRCLIGCFIPDGHEALSETIPILPLLTGYPDLEGFMPFKDKEALTTFQRLHDDLSENKFHKK